VVEVGRRGGLPPEPLDEGRIGGELGEQDLDGHRPVEELVAREEDLGHATAAEAAVQLVSAVEDLGALRRHARESLEDCCRAAEIGQEGAKGQVAGHLVDSR
jgi:hypothetical protein